MVYKDFAITADTRETVYSEYELEDWDMVGDEIVVNDSSDFEIVGYCVNQIDKDGRTSFKEYFQTKEEVIEYIDKQSQKES